eukprot:g11909.t1
MKSIGASTIGAHQLNFCKSAEEIRSSLRSLISRYEAELTLPAQVSGEKAAEQNINEDCSSVDLTPADLEGCAESFVESLPSTEAGLKRCALKAPTLVPILQRCKSSATRRRMMEASQRKCIEVNTPVLEELIAARHTAAVKLGFSCHAERMLASKMAGNLKTAKGFLD